GGAARDGDAPTCRIRIGALELAASVQNPVYPRTQAKHVIEGSVLQHQDDEVVDLLEAHQVPPSGAHPRGPSAAVLCSRASVAPWATTFRPQHTPGRNIVTDRPLTARSLLRREAMLDSHPTGAYARCTNRTRTGTAW